MVKDEVITDDDLAREMHLQIMIGEKATATRIGQQLIVRIRTKRLAMDRPAGLRDKHPRGRTPRKIRKGFI